MLGSGCSEGLAMESAYRKQRHAIQTREGVSTKICNFASTLTFFAPTYNHIPNVVYGETAWMMYFDSEQWLHSSPIWNSQRSFLSHVQEANIKIVYVLEMSGERRSWWRHEYFTIFVLCFGVLGFKHFIFIRDSAVWHPTPPHSNESQKYETVTVNNVRRQEIESRLGVELLENAHTAAPFPSMNFLFFHLFLRALMAHEIVWAFTIHLPHIDIHCELLLLNVPP